MRNITKIFKIYQCHAEKHVQYAAHCPPQYATIWKRKILCSNVENCAYHGMLHVAYYAMFKVKEKYDGIMEVQVLEVAPQTKF